MESGVGRDNVIRFCSRTKALHAQFVIVRASDCWSVESDDGALIWSGALPLIERACSAVRFTTEDAKRWHLSGQIMPVGLVNQSGDFLMVALTYTWDSPEMGHSLVAVIAPDGPWISGGLSAVIWALFDIGKSRRYERIALRSPDEFPSLYGWEKVDLPDGPALMRRVDDPPRPEYDGLMSLYNV